jgi:hypothetical protein
MESLIIGNTTDTPGVYLDKESNTLRIDGNSYPENVSKIFDPILSWFVEYAKAPNPVSAFEFKLEYFNTASAKMILEIMSLMEELESSFEELSVKWYYIEDDEDMEEAGVGFMEMVDLKFELIPYSE